MRLRVQMKCDEIRQGLLIDSIYKTSTFCALEASLLKTNLFVPYHAVIARTQNHQLRVILEK